jgi:hypothetical protein
MSDGVDVADFVEFVYTLYGDGVLLLPFSSL